MHGQDDLKAVENCSTYASQTALTGARGMSVGMADERIIAHWLAQWYVCEYMTVIEK